MTSHHTWARSLFKGRIAEAVVESVLSEFGYQVLRSGSENHRIPGPADRSAEQVFAPDLAVNDPKTRTTKYVEVKFRSARPMSVILEASRLDNIRRYYPGTILIFVSSYDGSVNCANVDEMTPARVRARPDGFCEFDLLSPSWRPIWHFFPLVQPGERLQRLWASLKSDLHTYAESHVSSTSNSESFPEERVKLETYITGNWNPDMELYSGRHSYERALTLDELWEEVRKINACLFALDIHGDENFGTNEFSNTVDRLLGHRGEKYVAVDLNELRVALYPHPDLLVRFDQIRSKAISEQDPDDRFYRGHVGAMVEFFRALPAGVGKAYLLSEQGTLDEALEIDFRTFFAMMQKRNRLDADQA